MADYGLLVMSHMCGQRELMTLDSLSELTALPLPTMRKLMRALTQNGLADSVRGPHGGYQLSRQPQQISIAEIIEAIDGPIALTECVKSDGGDCEIEGVCELKANWNIVNRLISDTLQTVTLDMMSQVPINVKRLKSELKAMTFQKQC